MYTAYFNLRDLIIAGKVTVLSNGNGRSLKFNVEEIAFEIFEKQEGRGRPKLLMRTKNETDAAGVLQNGIVDE